jgi:hypothetical protein
MDAMATGVSTALLPAPASFLAALASAGLIEVRAAPPWTVGTILEDLESQST